MPVLQRLRTALKTLSVGDRSAYRLGLSLLLLALSSCATLSAAAPEPELVITGLSALKKPDLARPVAEARAAARAGLVKWNVRFVLDRSRSRPLLKLVGEAASAGVTPASEPRKPVGQRATIRLKRTEAELAALRGLQVVRVQTEASGLDLAVAQDRADRALFRDAVLVFANARGLQDPQLYGSITIVNYSATDEGDRIVVRADLSVAFGPRAKVLNEGTPVASVSEDREETGEESWSDGQENDQPTSAPASAPVK